MQTKEGEFMRIGYLIGVLFFLTGSLMLFLHELASVTIHYLMNFVNEKTIKLNGAFDLVGILFMIVGVLIGAYSFSAARKIAQSPLT
jgi:predicted transporter